MEVNHVHHKRGKEHLCGPRRFSLPARHQPEKTLLYQLVSKHNSTFRQLLAEEGSALPGYVQREFKDYLKCGRLEHGFLQVHCETCHEERLVAFSCKRCGIATDLRSIQVGQKNGTNMLYLFIHNI